MHIFARNDLTQEKRLKINVNAQHFITILDLRNYRTRAVNNQTEIFLESALIARSL